MPRSASGRLPPAGRESPEPRTPSARSADAVRRCAPRKQYRRVVAPGHKARPALNHGRTPDQVMASTREAVMWRCPEGPDHVWNTPVVARTAQKNGSPLLRGQTRFGIEPSGQSARPVR
ncbi:zinc-ribbon domain-containing protein [Streptomyces sp. NPDC055749]